MATFVKFGPFVEALAEKVHNLGSDTLRLALTNGVLTTGLSAYAQISGLAPAGGYTASGFAVTVTDSSQTTGTYQLVITDAVFTANATGIGPFQYAVLYNDSATNDELIGYWDYGSAVTLGDTETFTVDFGATVLTIT